MKVLSSVTKDRPKSAGRRPPSRRVKDDRKITNAADVFADQGDDGEEDDDLFSGAGTTSTSAILPVAAAAPAPTPAASAAPVPKQQPKAALNFGDDDDLFSTPAPKQQPQPTATPAATTSAKNARVQSNADDIFADTPAAAKPKAAESKAKAKAEDPIDIFAEPKPKAAAAGGAAPKKKKDTAGDMPSIFDLPDPVTAKKAKKKETS